MNPSSHPHSYKDEHERARQLIALAGAEASTESSSNAWLMAHLQTCASCRAFAEHAAETIQGLRAIPIAADRNLVSTTQMKVRRRAVELQRSREHRWMVVVSCVVVTFGALFSTLALWRGFQWLGAREQLASSVWQVSFVMFCALPALIVAIALLAKGIHLANHHGSYRG